MKKIETIEQLKIERIRLMQLKMNLEVEIENDFKELKHSFSPSRLIPAGISNMVSSNHHGILNEGIGMMVDVLVRKVIFRNAGFIAKLVIPMLAKNAAGNLLSDNKVKILNWFGDLLSKNGKRKKKDDVIHDRSTADIYN